MNRKRKREGGKREEEARCERREEKREIEERRREEREGEREKGREERIEEREKGREREIGLYHVPFLPYRNVQYRNVPCSSLFEIKTKGIRSQKLLGPVSKR